MCLIIRDFRHKRRQPQIWPSVQPRSRTFLPWLKWHSSEIFDSANTWLGHDNFTQWRLPVSGGQFKKVYKQRYANADKRRWLLQSQLEAWITWMTWPLITILVRLMHAKILLSAHNGRPHRQCIDVVMIKLTDEIYWLVEGEWLTNYYY